MAPTDLGRIVFGSELRVVDKKICAIDEFGVSKILPGDFPVAGCQHARVGFVVTAIHYRCPIGLQPITERERWMIKILGGDLYIVDIESTLNKVVPANLGSALIKGDGEIGKLHLPGQRFTQGLAEAPGAVDVPFVTRHKKRLEERDALDVIPMRMTDQDMAAQAFGAGQHQLLTQSVTSGSAIDNDKCAPRRLDLDARRISSVTSRARSGLGYRTASSPELYSHVASARPASLPPHPQNRLEGRTRP
jgi:hypothetical protein